jgi:hypothetical protein
MLRPVISSACHSQSPNLPAGGIDSRRITAVARTIIMDRVTRFSCGDDVDVEALVRRYCNASPFVYPIFRNPSANRANQREQAAVRHGCQVLLRFHDDYRCGPCYCLILWGVHDSKLPQCLLFDTSVLQEWLANRACLIERALDITSRRHGPPMWRYNAAIPPLLIEPHFPQNTLKARVRMKST